MKQKSVGFKKKKTLYPLKIFYESKIRILIKYENNMLLKANQVQQNVICNEWNYNEWKRNEKLNTKESGKSVIFKQLF